MRRQEPAQNGPCLAIGQDIEARTLRAAFSLHRCGPAARASIHAASPGTGLQTEALRRVRSRRLSFQGWLIATVRAPAFRAGALSASLSDRCDTDQQNWPVSAGFVRGAASPIVRHGGITAGAATESSTSHHKPHRCKHLKTLARPAGIGTARGERSESRRFPMDCRTPPARKASWRARQDSNLRPPA
jgi:hypothetical protein